MGAFPGLIFASYVDLISGRPALTQVRKKVPWARLRLEGQQFLSREAATWEMN